MAHLFACSKCFKRFPFEDLSAGDQLCKACQGPILPVKCQFCRQDFVPQAKLTEKPTCRVCDEKIVKYGPPKPCALCNVIAAFGSSKCARCGHYEKKYGPPRQCESCKQRCAFDKPDEKNLLNGKKLCWVCAASYRKSLRRSNDRKRKLSGRDRRSDRSSREGGSGGAFEEDSSRSSLPGVSSSSSGAANSSQGGRPAKLNRGGLKSSSNSGGTDEADPSSSDHMATIAQMREEIANMKKQLTSKDQQMLAKDKLITELRAQIHNTEQQYRQKSKTMQKLHEDEMTELRIVTKDLQIKVASLTKLTKGKGLLANSGSNSSSQNNSPDL